MTVNPSEVEIDAAGSVAIPMSVLAEAGLNPCETVLAYSDGDGRIVLQRLTDAMHDLITGDGLR